MREILAPDDAPETLNVENVVVVLTPHSIEWAAVPVSLKSAKVVFPPPWTTIVLVSVPLSNHTFGYVRFVPNGPPLKRIAPLEH